MDSTRAADVGHRTPEKWNSVPVPERVARRAYENVDKQRDGCWISRYSVASHGYAQIGWRREHKTSMVLAHRAAWVHDNGQVPLGMTLDHLCKTRRCVNPAHLRMLPNYENARRVHGLDWPMGQCANGHASTSLVRVASRNKRGASRDGRVCDECRVIYRARWAWKRDNGSTPFPEELRIATDRKDQR